METTLQVKPQNGTKTMTVIPTDSSDDPALLAAWGRLMDYDNASSFQKRLYQQLRTWYIVLSLIATGIAVVSGYVILLPVIGAPVADVLRILLVALPILSVGVMTYATKFATSTTWIEYRVRAELIRSHIYLYRVRAGDYRDKGDDERRMQLLNVVEQVDGKRHMEAEFVPYMNLPDADMKTKIAKATNSSPGTDKEDKGLDELNIQQYLDWRVKKQIEWYIGKISADYSKKKRFFRFGLLISGAGAVVAALDASLVPLVAVTTAMGVALSLYGNINMYGATYGIFHDAARDLQIRLNRWESRSTTNRTPEAAAALAVDMEKIFEKERSTWETQAKQMQQMAEQSFQVRDEQGGDAEADAPAG